MQRALLSLIALCVAPALVAAIDCTQCAVGVTAAPAAISGNSLTFHVVAPNCNTGCPLTFSAPVDNCIIKSATGMSGVGSLVNGVFTYEFTYTAPGGDITVTDNFVPGAEVQMVSQPVYFTDANGHTTTLYYPRPKCPCVNGCLSISKFYDTNADGVKNNGEQLLTGWVFKVTNTYTGAYAFYTAPQTISDLPVGTYQVCDLQPNTFNWWPTTGLSCRTVTIATGACASAEFGCVCTGTGNAILSAYFLNGTEPLTSGDFAALDALDLYSPPGNTPYTTPFTSRAQFTSWYNNAKSGAGASPLTKLSAQRALVELNVRHGVSTSAFIKTYQNVMVDLGSSVPVGTLASVIAFADTLLAGPSSNTALLNDFAGVLANTNTNQGFEQSTPCSFAFSQDQTPSDTPLVRPCGCRWPPAYAGGNCGNCLNGLTLNPSISGYTETIQVTAPNCPVGCSLTLNFTTPFCATKTAIGGCGTLVSERPQFAYKFFPGPGTTGIPISITDSFTPGSTVSFQLGYSSFIDEAGHVKTYRVPFPVCAPGSPPAPAIVEEDGTAKGDSNAVVGVSLSTSNVAIIAGAVGVAVLVALAVALFIRRRMAIAPKASKPETPSVELL